MAESGRGGVVRVGGRLGGGGGIGARMADATDGDGSATPSEMAPASRPSVLESSDTLIPQEPGADPAPKDISAEAAGAEGDNVALVTPAEGAPAVASPATPDGLLPSEPASDWPVPNAASPAGDPPGEPSTAAVPDLSALTDACASVDSPAGADERVSPHATPVGNEEALQAAPEAAREGERAPQPAAEASALEPAAAADASSPKEHARQHAAQTAAADASASQPAPGPAGADEDTPARVALDEPGPQPAAKPPTPARLTKQAAAAKPSAGLGDGEWLACPHVDVACCDELSGRLLHCLACQIVMRSLSPEAAIAELRKSVLPAESGKHETRGPFGLAEPIPFGMELLRTRIERAQSKKSLGGMLAHTFTKDQLAQRVTAKQHELDQGGLFTKELRDSLAKILVRHYDLTFENHCSMNLTGASPEEIERHKAGCQFRTVACEHTGCGVLMSAHRLAQHDHECEHKRVPCTRGCGDLVPRCAMLQHVEGSCTKKPVVCPFSSVGCTVDCTQGELRAHLAAETQQHLWLAVARIGAQQQLIEQLRKDVADSRERAKAASDESLALKKLVESMRKEHDTMLKQHKATEAHVKRTEERLTKLSHAQGSGERELKAAVNKLVGDHLQLKGTVEATLNRER